MLLVAEIAMLVLGFVAMVTGKLPIGGPRVVRGAPARWLGLLAMTPLPLAFLIGLVIGIVAVNRGVQLDLTDLSAILIAAWIQWLTFLLVVGLVFGIGWRIAGRQELPFGGDLADPEFDPRPAKDPVMSFAPPNPGYHAYRHDDIPTTSGMAVASLVLGFLSGCLMFLTGIPALWLGILGLMEIDRSRGKLQGRPMAIIGIILGSLGTIAGVALLVIVPYAMRQADQAREDRPTARFIPVPKLPPPPPTPPRPPAPPNLDRLARKAAPTAPKAKAPRKAAPPRDDRPRMVARVRRDEGDATEIVAVLGTFLASAVDPGSKTALIATGAGPIKVFNYPEFQPRGSFRIGGVAFRLALDPGRGRLYAFILKERDVLKDFGAIDHAVGDLHVYDVKAILEGGTPPGNPLKPLATAPIKDSTFRVVLAPDRGSLYWLQGKVKDRFAKATEPKLVRFDADPMAIGGSLELPDGTDRFSLSLDGKSAYASGSGGSWRAGGSEDQSGWIVEVDPSTMEARQKVTIEAIPFDIAASVDGRVYLDGSSPSCHWLVAEVDMKSARSIVGSWQGGTGRDYLHRSPDGRRLYLMTTGQSPAELLSWELPATPGEPVVERSRVAHGDGSPIQGDFLITPDGRFLLSGRGSVFRLPAGE